MALMADSCLLSTSSNFSHLSHKLFTAAFSHLCFSSPSRSFLQACQELRETPGHDYAWPPRETAAQASFSLRMASRSSVSLSNWTFSTLCFSSSAANSFCSRSPQHERQRKGPLFSATARCFRTSATLLVSFCVIST